jgi:hypothetical protein
MSKRLQVLLPDQEMTEIQRLAQSEQLSVGEWVRRALRDAKAARPIADAEKKLRAVRRAAQHSFPTTNIEEMLKDIERGYQS